MEKIINNLFNIYLFRNSTYLEISKYNNLFLSGRFTINNLINIIVNSNEYKIQTRIKLNKLFKELFNREVNNKEYIIFFNYLKQNKNNYRELLNKLSKNDELTLKIKKIYNKYLETDIDDNKLLEYKNKIKNNKIILEDIEHKVLISDKCCQLIDNKINNWLRNNK